MAQSCFSHSLSGSRLTPVSLARPGSRQPHPIKRETPRNMRTGADRFPFDGRIDAVFRHSCNTQKASFPLANLRRPLTYRRPIQVGVADFVTSIHDSYHTYHTYHTDRRIQFHSPAVPLTLSNACCVCRTITLFTSNK